MKHLNFSGILILLAILISGEVSLSQTCATCPGNTVTGVSASAFGAGNTASGNYSFVAGRNSTANQSYATVIGSNSRASGGHSYVVGSSSFANGNFSYVFGGNSITNFDFSTAIGHNLVANNGGFVLGQGRVDAVLTNNLQGSLMIGFNSQYPTLFVGRTDINNQSGRVGIGNVTDPQAKLHIRADAGKDADLLLEPGDENQTALLRLGQNNSISARDGSDMHFETTADKAFVFHQGDIFLEDIQSGIIMKSPNGQCWRGTLNDQGTLNFAQTTCPEGTSTAVQSHNSEKLMLVYPNPTGDKVTVEVSLHGQAAVLQLTSQDGKVLRQQILNTNIAQISLSQLPRGMYLINLLQDGKTLATGKVVKE